MKGFEMQSTTEKTYLSNQILKALPLPLSGNGEIKIKIHSDRGETNWLTIDPQTMAKIEMCLIPD
jgi:hypothetical protein